ncbi:hypothetical protein FA95DRAFT_517086 [Auriscalpium vulgare]|uniref:Uncharacterized protein n=1 Tax=Auriscalpium vulgare TaxID=40419 RepID=A0ACB8S3X3_9AGAM|nr:hypothetical protein FA95DRAFT_517086 [Auriscalpium vulgare]
MTMSILGTSLAVLKEILDAANSVPYVKVVAGVMLQIIQIKDDVDNCAEKWQEVMQNIASVAKVICSIWDLSRKYERIALPQDLVDLLKSMETDLLAVVEVMKRCRIGEGKRQKVKAVLQRSDLLKDIMLCDGRLKQIVTDYQNLSLASIRFHQHVSDQQPQPSYYGSITVNVTNADEQIPKVIRIPDQLHVLPYWALGVLGRQHLPGPF